MTNKLNGKVSKWYPALVRGCAIAVAAVTSYPLRHDLDVFAVVFNRYDLHPMVGCIPAIFAAVFLGRQIHDYISERKSHAPAAA